MNKLKEILIFAIMILIMVSIWYGSWWLSRWFNWEFGYNKNTQELYEKRIQELETRVTNLELKFDKKK